MIEKEIMEIIGNRAFRISILTQIFLIFVMVFMYKTYANIDQYNIPITVAVNSNDTTMITALKDSGVNVIVKENTTEEQNWQSQSAAKPRQQNQVAEIDMNTKEIKSDSSNILTGIAIARIKVASRIKSFEDLLLENRFSFQTNGYQDKNEFAQLAYSLIIPLIVLFPAIVSMTLASQNILLEKKKKTIELLLVSPISNLHITVAKIVPLAAVSVVTSVLLFAVAANDVEIKNYPVLIALAGITGLAGTAFGIIISTSSRTVREANAVSAIVAILAVGLMIIPGPVAMIMPHTVAARAAVTTVDFWILSGLALNAAAALVVCYAAYLSIKGMRKNYY